MALSRKEKRKLFEKHLSFQLKYAHESLAKSRDLITQKLNSEIERAQYWHDIIVKKNMTVMEHPRSQEYHAKEMIRIWEKALYDFNRLVEGVGTKEELETFKMFFVVPNPKKRKAYRSAEEMDDQTKLFSLD